MRIDLDSPFAIHSRYGDQAAPGSLYNRGPTITIECHPIVCGCSFPALPGAASFVDPMPFVSSTPVMLPVIGPKIGGLAMAFLGLRILSIRCCMLECKILLWLCIRQGEKSMNSSEHKACVRASLTGLHRHP